MMFAQKLMRPIGLAILLLAILCMCGAPALAVDSDPVDFTIQVSPQSMTEPGEVKVSLRVANTGAEDMIDPVTLYDPAGNLVGSFGDGGSYLLSAGAFRTWEGTWNVTQDELDAGEFAYTLKYHLEDDAGELVEFSRQAVAKVEFTGERVKLSVSRNISPEVVRSGKQATVTYELYNSGNVDLTDIRVKENISKNAQTVKTLAAGEKKTLTFTSRIGNADLTSSASITYKAKGSTKTLTENVAEMTVPLARPNLKIELSSPSAGVNIGEAAKLVVTCTNNGNISYSNVTIKDEKKGEILTNLSIPAGATVVEEKEFILLEPTTFKVTATLPDNTGETQNYNAGELTIGVFDPEKTLLLTLNLTCDQETIHETPADVRFQLAVTNNSNIKAENISIHHGDIFICTIASLEPGASTVITRDARISQAGKFRFTAQVKDTLQNLVSFDSNTIQITYARPTAAPTQVPVVTVAPPVFMTAIPADPVLSQTRDALLTLAMALAALFAIGFLLFVVSTVVRLHKKSKSRAAYDHLELAERRDYTEPADDDDEDDDDDDDEDDNEMPERHTEEMAFELPHQKLIRPLERKEDAPEAPAAEEMPASDGEGGYRVSRVAPAEEIPQAPEVSAAPEAPTKEETASSPAAQEDETPRRRRSRRAQRTEDGE